MKSTAHITFFPDPSAEPRVVGETQWPLCVGFTDQGGADCWLYFRSRDHLLATAAKLEELADPQADPFLPRLEPQWAGPNDLPF